jgi:nucleoside 2-deoxyribosyltransferase
MLKIYGASKLTYAPMWRRLRTEWSEFEWTACWPDHPLVLSDDPYVAQEGAPAITFQRAWETNEQDVRRADIVLLYCEPDDVLCGALVEAGMALGQGQSVFVVGENPGIGTWRYHPKVAIFDKMNHVRLTLLGISAQMRQVRPR